MKARGFLEKAIETLAERGGQYESGKEENSMAEIVALQQFLIGDADQDGMTELEGWYFMLALKLVRLRKSIQQNKARKDSIVDLLGYTAKMGECLFPDEEPPKEPWMNAEMKANRDAVEKYVNETCPHTVATMEDVGDDVLGIVCDACGYRFAASEYCGRGVAR